jgi:hypothetical protein
MLRVNSEKCGHCCDPIEVRDLFNQDNRESIARGTIKIKIKSKRAISLNLEDNVEGKF